MFGSRRRTSQILAAAAGGTGPAGAGETALIALTSHAINATLQRMSDDDLPPGDEPFQIPLPPPPPGAFGRDVLYFRGSGPMPEGAGQRDAEDIMLRRVPTATAMRFRAAAGGRGMTHAQYLAALVGLHEEIRTAADGGDAALAAVLDKLGLQTVSV